MGVVILVGKLRLRCTAYSAAVQKQRVGPVESPEVVGSAFPAAENAVTFHVEGPALLEERLHIAEVHHRWIHFHLAEIRVYRGIHGEIATDSQLQVSTGSGGETGAVIERILRLVAQILSPSSHIGEELQARRWSDLV